MPAVFRARDLAAATDGIARDALAREVEYARTSTNLYAAALKEADGARRDIAALNALVDGLAGSIASARIAAAHIGGRTE